MELKCESYDLIIINIYMPYLDRSDVQNVVSRYDEVLGYIDYIMSERVNAKFIVLGDFNCNVFDSSHPFSASVNDFISSKRLVNAFSLMDSFSVSIHLIRDLILDLDQF